MKALTVQQPWAWAIVHGGKDVENRTTAWAYRGPLAIHAGARLSERGCNMVPGLLDRTDPAALSVYTYTNLVYGAIIGVVDLVDAHTAVPDCCESPWGEQSYAEHGGQTRRDVVHLVLANPVALPEPIRCVGRLGLWTPPPSVMVS